jgi:4-diphosphocytidyl-2-C-methyl-D-erythritol kinase
MSARSSTMLTVAAPAKLNLFLHVTGRRTDGYHLLQTLFVFLDIADSLRLEVREDGEISRVSHNYAEEVLEDVDLIIRAARLLQAKSGSPLGANIRIDKRLPMGGGLGGGSSDAASVLLALNRLWSLNWPTTRLAELGLQLGADVPVFIHGHAAWAEGVGEMLQPVDVAPFFALVLVPPTGVSTPLIFRDPELTRDTLALKMASFPAGPYFSGLAAQQKAFLARQRNDLQAVACRLAPTVAEHLAALDQVSAGAWFAEGRKGGARMTGSGACVFAMFDREDEAKAAQDRLPAGMKSFVARGLNRHPLHEDEAYPGVKVQ